MGRLPLFRSNGSVNFKWGSERVSRTTLYPFCICVVRCLSDCPFAATSRTENITQFSRFSCFCSCSKNSFLLSVHSVQHMLSAVFCSEAAKRQNTKKRIYSSNNRGSGKVETADSPRNFGQIFPTDRLWKAFSTRGKWKVCGVENKSLWKKSWKTCRTRNTASTSCGKHIPQLSTTDSTSPLL